MTEQSVRRCVDLKQMQVDYLLAARFLPPDLPGCLRSVQWRSATAAALELSPVAVEEFRDALTEQLARVEFDEAHGLTTEGRLLEDLIDHFHAH